MVKFLPESVLVSVRDGIGKVENFDHHQLRGIRVFFNVGVQVGVGDSAQQAVFGVLQAVEEDGNGEEHADEEAVVHTDDNHGAARHYPHHLWYWNIFNILSIKMFY